MGNNIPFGLILDLYYTGGLPVSPLDEHPHPPVKIGFKFNYGSALKCLCLARIVSWCAGWSGSGGRRRSTTQGSSRTGSTAPVRRSRDLIKGKFRF